MEKPARTVFEVDLRSVGGFLLDYVWMIGGCAVAGAILACAFAISSPDVYEAQSTIQVEQESWKNVTVELRAQADRDSREVLNTIEQKFTSPDLLLRVAHSTELLEDPDFFPEEERPISDTRLLRLLKDSISAEVRPETNLIDISAQDQNPGMAQKLAKLVVSAFLASENQSSADTAMDAGDYLRKESERLAEKLAESERKLQEYRKQNQAVSLEEKQNIIVERLRELNLKVTAAKAERLRLESDVAQVARLGSGSPEKLLAIQAIVNSTAVTDIRRRIAEKETELATLARRYKPEYPKYAAAVSEFRQLQESLDRALTRAVAIVRSSHNAALATEEKLEEALKAQEELALELDQIAIPYQVLAREVESDRALYESVLTRLKESGVSKGASDSSIRIVSQPLVPDRPVKPNRPRLAFLGLFGGIAIGASLAMARRAIDNSIRTLSEAEARLGLRALGVVPCYRPARHGKLQSMIPIASNPDSAVAESFRALRTSILFLNNGAARQSVLFTSAAPSEGKTFCSVNCAASFAQTGTRTLLIDADLRRPGVSRLVFGETWKCGLTEALTGEIPWENSVLPTELEHLHVLPAGAGRHANPAEVLATGDFAEILRAAMGRFERVVIDTAPVNAVSDTLLIARMADIVGLVVRAGRTPATTLRRAKQKLEDVGCHPSGFVFNNASIRHSDGYYYSGYADGYSYRSTSNPKRRLPEKIA